MGVTITTKDLGAREIFAELGKLNGLDVTVGYQDASGRVTYPDGTPVATVAALTEFGTTNPDGTVRNPARSFLRSTLFEERGTIQTANEVAFSKVANGKATAMEAFREIGSLMVLLVKTKIATARSWAAPNEPSTIENKGSATPLHDTGLLEESVTWAIRKGSTILETGS